MAFAYNVHRYAEELDCWVELVEEEIQTDPTARWNRMPSDLSQLTLSQLTLGVPRPGRLHLAASRIQAARRSLLVVWSSA